MATPTTVAENDIVKIAPEDAIYIRYLSSDKVDDKEGYLALVSFTLNSVSKSKQIVKPLFVDKEQSVIRFDLRDYDIDPKIYEVLPVDPYGKKSEKLNEVTKSKNALIRVDWFIIKSLETPIYYKLLGVSNLKGFRSRYGDNGAAKKVRAEQAAVVILSNLSRYTRYIKRIPTVTGSVWEARDSSTIDYLSDLLSDKYDSIQLVAFNANGLLSYFAADNKGRAMEHLPVEIAIDRSRVFEPDLVVRMARSCIACHTVGILPVDDSVRKIKNDFQINGTNKDATDRLNDLFGSDLPVEKDQDIYKAALLKATGMDMKTFTRKFVEVWTNYYKDVTLEQAAKELDVDVEVFKKECLNSKQVYLLDLAVRGKISRVRFEKLLETK